MIYSTVRRAVSTYPYFSASVLVSALIILAVLLVAPQRAGARSNTAHPIPPYYTITAYDMGGATCYSFDYRRGNISCVSK